MEDVRKPRRPSRRVLLYASLFALALVTLPFLFWYDTWFGRPLTDRQIDRYLAQSDKPRRQQQALVQIGERIGRGDRTVERWYPKVVELSKHPSREIRSTAAWIMGQDAGYQPFHDALLPMLEDPSPLVRRDAALGLAAFRDPRAKPEVRSMLHSYTVYSPFSGKLKLRLKEGEYTNPGTLIARVDDKELRSPLPGAVVHLYEPDGADIRMGQRVSELAPDDQHVFEALRALYLIGDRYDSEDVRRFAGPQSRMPEKVRQQAELTLRALEGREK